MWINIIGQGVLVTMEGIMSFFERIGPIVISVVAIVIAVRRNKKGDHDAEHEKIEKKQDKMETSLHKKIDKIEEDNKGSHGRRIHEMENYYSILEKQLEIQRQENSQKLDMIIKLVERIERNGKNGKT